MVAAAQDEISAAISKLFGGYGQEFQALSAQAGLFHSSFVQALTSGQGLYSFAEAANAAAVAAGALPATAVQDPLTRLVDFAQPFGIVSPVEAITGRSLFVNGATGAAGGAAPARPAVTARPADGLSATAVTAGPAGPAGRRCRRCRW